MIPTKKGICLRPLEYVRLKELLPEIGNALPELNWVVHCFLQSDHMNHLGVLQCSECYPNDFYSENPNHFYHNSVRYSGIQRGYSEGTVGYSGGTVRVQ